MWFYHWCGVVNELLKKFRFGLTTFVELFTQVLPRIYSHVPSLNQAFGAQKQTGIRFGVKYKDSGLW